MAVYHEGNFEEAGEQLPELYVMVEDDAGNLLYSSEEELAWKRAGLSTSRSCSKLSPRGKRGKTRLGASKHGVENPTRSFGAPVVLTRDIDSDGSRRALPSALIALEHETRAVIIAVGMNQTHLTMLHWS
jgi:hypothetical protein